MLCCLPLDEVDSRCSLNYTANLTRLERKGSVLEFLLHVSMAKEATAHS